jgi:hypothetical protein
MDHAAFDFTDPAYVTADAVDPHLKHLRKNAPIGPTTSASGRGI